jgi:dGTPase
MLKKFDQLTSEEDDKLAPYSVKNGGNHIRIYPEEDHNFRLPFQRDRDRIIHSRAFRRLEYKTQVFIASIGDNYRTRLTHTLEVSALARSVAVALGLNPYLAENIALAHDLGHAPFGHAGQDKLSEIMRGKGGFEHNKQSLRIVQHLENRYANFRGLNLCIETLIGIMKHGGDYGDSADLLDARKISGPSLEALITDICDSIAYNNHDVEDGLESGLIQPEDLSSLKIWDYHFKKSQEKFPSTNKKLILRETVRSMMNSMVADFLETIELNLNKFSIRSREDLTESWKKGHKIVTFSDSMHAQITELKKFLTEKLYKHPEVTMLSDFGKEVIEVLFIYFEKNPKKMPESYTSRIESEGLHRVVCDYIAGMTDRYAEEIAIDLELLSPFQE